MWEFGQRAGLFDLPSRPICTLHGDEFGRDLSRKALAKAADHKLRGLQQSAGLFNADTGWMLRINKNGRSKMGDNPQLTPVESQAIAGIERLVEQAVLAETHGDVEHRNPQVLAKHAKTFPKVNAFTVDEVFGNWLKAQKEHFDDGAVYDQILAANRK